MSDTVQFIASRELTKIFEAEMVKMIIDDNLYASLTPFIVAGLFVRSAT